MASIAGADLATRAMAVDLALTVGVAGPFYLGGSMAFGGADREQQYFALGAAVGARTTIADRVGVRAELAGGYRSIADRGGPDVMWASQTSGELQARVRVELFLSPRFSVGATVGRSLIDRDDTLVVVSIAGHLLAFDDPSR